MGTYYMVACDKLKERINPSNINNLGIKAGPIAHPNHPFGQVVMFALLNRWSNESIRLVNDGQSDEDAFFEYADVTKEVLSDYNEYYQVELIFTGEDSEQS